MYSPIIYWGSRGELPQSSNFLNTLKSMDLKEIWNLIPEEYKKDIMVTTSKGVHIYKEKKD